MSEMAEKMTAHAVQARAVLGLPEKDEDVVPEEPSKYYLIVTALKNLIKPYALLLKT